MSTKTRRKLSYEENQQPAAEVCALCKVHHDHMSHPLAWKNEKAREFISEQRIQQHQKICRPCRDDISRVIANPAFKRCCSLTLFHYQCHSHTMVQKYLMSSSISISSVIVTISAWSQLWGRFKQCVHVQPSLHACCFRLHHLGRAYFVDF